MYTIQQIEDAIVNELQPLKASLGVRVIKSYQGELESEEDINRLVRLFPAIYVVYGGSQYTEHGARKIEKMSYVLFVCDKSLRAEEEARRGGAKNPGTYAMLNAIRDKLFGSMLSLEIFPIDLLREVPVWFSRGISIYSAEYETAQALLYPST